MSDTNVQLTTTPNDLITLAISNNLDIDKLEKLLAMKERWDKEQARKAYFSALADFQIECPEIRKTKGVSFKEGGPIVYHYAPLGDIDRQIKKLLKKFGLTKNWKFYNSNGKTKVACIITHTDGHSEITEMEADDDKSGSKNAIQGTGSAIEYMKRYTLIGALGMTTTDSDIDGRMGEYDTDLDRLHATFMETYNQVIQIDSTLSKWHPDNWLVEKTGKNYIKVIGEIRKVLFELQNKKK